jgi:endonuclease/exonuclease/phosphatase family metal-dependent hydrolase
MAVPEGVIHNERLAQRAAQLDVDLLAIQEVDYFQPRSHHVDQADEIALALGAKFQSRAFAITGTPGERWEKFSGSMKDGERYYGNGIISRIPIVEEFRLELGRSRVGAPLAIPQNPPGSSRPKMKLIYIHDEPRVAHAVYLQNGITVINTHLSFVPGVNAYQLRKIRQWAKTLPGKKILVGDLNLPGNIPERIMKWRSAATEFTYPSWGARLQFDHILLSTPEIKIEQKLGFAQPLAMVSDHLPLGVEISLV